MEIYAFDGDDFIRTVIWEFPSYEKAIECHNSKEYLAGWDIAKDTTERHMQVLKDLVLNRFWIYTSPQIPSCN